MIDLVFTESQIEYIRSEYSDDVSERIAVNVIFKAMNMESAKGFEKVYEATDLNGGKAAIMLLGDTENYEEDTTTYYASDSSWISIMKVLQDETSVTFKQFHPIIWD